MFQKSFFFGRSLPTDNKLIANSFQTLCISGIECESFRWKKIIELIQIQKINQ